MSIPTLVEGDQLICDAKEKAKVLNDYFCDQNTVDDSSATLPSHVTKLHPSYSLSTILTSEEEVNKLLKNVDTSEACGYDGIGNRILKLSANGISASFTNFVNYYMLSGLSLANGKLRMLFQYTKG